MYLSVDGGGSKLRMLLVDEDLKPVDFIECGGVNTNFNSAEAVRETVRVAVERCIPPGAELHSVTYSILCSHEFLEEPIRTRARVGAFHPLSEGELGLLASIGRLEGFTALSGTGSHGFFYGNGARETVGGLGMLLGDEGSGYDIGQKGLKAAIQAHDGRGEPTMMLSLLLERWGLSREGLSHRLYQKVACSSVPRAMIASFSPIVGEAARLADRAAIAIYEQAGRDMARHVTALIRRLEDYGLRVSGYPITLCGGAWKGSAQMFRAFRSSVLERCPDAAVVWPVFDAVVGGLILGAMQDGRDKGDIIARLKVNCPGFLYRKPEDWKEADDG